MDLATVDWLTAIPNFRSSRESEALLLATTTSLPELFTGFGATALAALPDIALGDVLGSCMFNLLILSLMDAVHPEPYRSAVAPTLAPCETNRA